MSHWCCACHTKSHCNVPFPAPATQSHAPTLPGCFNRLRLPPNVTLVLRLPHNVTIQRTIPCTSHPDPHSNATRDLDRLRLPPNVTLVLRLPHSVTLQRTLPCTSHPEPRSNATRMLQSPATKCHTGAAPATQRHNSTYHSLHQPPRPTLQRYQGLGSTAPATKCHTHAAPAHTASHCNAPFPAPATQSHAPTLPGCFNHLPPNVTLVLRLPHNVTLQRTCNVPFPAPATQSHAPTLPGCFNRLRLPPNVTLVLRLPHNVTIQRTIPCTSHTDPRCNWKCHVYKRANFTCTSEPISRVQANPRPIWGIYIYI